MYLSLYRNLSVFKNSSCKRRLCLSDCTLIWGSCCYISLSRDPKRETRFVFLFVVNFGDHFEEHGSSVFCSKKACWNFKEGFHLTPVSGTCNRFASWFLWQLLQYHTEIVYNVSLLVVLVQRCAALFSGIFGEAW